MCIVCEHQLYEEHRNTEAGPFVPCRKCKLFPDSSGQGCYHCFALGNTIDECPECLGKEWSAEFLAVKAEVDEELGEEDGEPSKGLPF